MERVIPPNAIVSLGSATQRRQSGTLKRESTEVVGGSESAACYSISVVAKNRLESKPTGML